MEKINYFKSFKTVSEVNLHERIHISCCKILLKNNTNQSTAERVLAEWFHRQILT